MPDPGSEHAAVPVGENFFRPAAGASSEGLGFRLFNHPSRAACTVLSIGYFASVWLIDGSFWVNNGWQFLPLVIGFLYIFLTLPRWRDLGLGEVFFLAVLPQPFYLLFESMDGPLGVPLLGHFAAIVPVVFICITPLGVALPKFNGKTGRAAFILFALPFFLVLGAQNWPNLDLALSLLWSIFWSPIDKVTDNAVVVVSVFICFKAWGRMEDIGVRVSKIGGYVFMAAIALFYFLRISDSLQD
jgi:hypothetical protein